VEVEKDTSWLVTVKLALISNMANPVDNDRLHIAGLIGENIEAALAPVSFCLRYGDEDRKAAWMNDRRNTCTCLTC
jgi:hypothetical protein